MCKYRKKFLLVILLSLVFCNLTACAEADETRKTRDIIDVSINDLKLGQKVPAKMTSREYLVMDADYRYIHGDVGFDVDGENRIDYLCFFATFHTDGDNLGFEDANIVYKGTAFDDFNDMVAYFEENNQVADGTEDSDILSYEDDTCKVRVYFNEEDFSGIVIKYK